MKKLPTWFPAACIFLLLLASCAPQDQAGKPLANNLPVLTVSQAIEPGRLGKTVQVRGKVEEVCQDEGCWLTVQDGTSGLRVSFKQSGFVVPMDLEGSVLVEGTVEEEVFEEEDAKLIAETMGWKDDQIRQIQGDTRLPIMVGTGVRFED
jgi:hypothetical protein